MKDTDKRVRYEIEKCKILNMPYGIKMVRGAYMNEENKIAKSKGIESPICKDFDATNEMMNNTLDYVVDNLTAPSEVSLN